MPEDINKENPPKHQTVEKKKYEFDFDELKMYFSEPYSIMMENGKFIEIFQPSVGEILQLGDREVYSSISPFVNNTTSYRVQLWEAGTDWNKITDYELFCSLILFAKNVDFLFKLSYYVENPFRNEDDSSEKYVKISKDIDFSKLKTYGRTKRNAEDAEDVQEVILYDQEQDILITEEIYMHIREYLRMMFDQHPKEELAKGKLAKRWIIEEEKEKIKLENEKNGGRRKSILLPMVSGLLNHPGFKYDLDGIKKLGIFAFMDSVRRLQLYEQCTAFMGGMYSGFMDTSKLGQEELNKRVNWLQDIYEK